MKKRILCYGDSNTYGYIPAGKGERYSSFVRWPKQLQIMLGDAYQIIEEGCSGRTTDLDSPGDEWRNGYSYLKTALYSHKPLDLVIILLGTNDLKEFFHRDETMIASAAGRLVKETVSFLAEKQGYRPEVLLISPPYLHDQAPVGIFGEEFSKGPVEVSHRLSSVFKQTAEETGALFLDAALYVEASVIDGVHFTPEGHGILAYQIRKIIEALWKEEDMNTDQKASVQDFITLCGTDYGERTDHDPAYLPAVNVLREGALQKDQLLTDLYIRFLHALIHTAEKEEKNGYTEYVKNGYVLFRCPADMILSDDYIKQKTDDSDFVTVRRMIPEEVSRLLFRITE